MRLFLPRSLACLLAAGPRSSEEQAASRNGNRNVPELEGGKQLHKPSARQMIGARLTAAHLSLQSTVAVLVHETDRIEITVHDSFSRT